MHGPAHVCQLVHERQLIGKDGRGRTQVQVLHQQPAAIAGLAAHQPRNIQAPGPPGLLERPFAPGAVPIDLENHLGSEHCDGRALREEEAVEQPGLVIDGQRAQKPAKTQLRLQLWQDFYNSFEGRHVFRCVHRNDLTLLLNCSDESFTWFVHVYAPLSNYDLPNIRGICGRTNGDTMRGAGQHFGRRVAYLVMGLLLISVIVAAAAVVKAVDSDNWTIADWFNLTISLLLGIYFFFLAQQVNSNAQKRAEALANADLITSAGRLAMSSARSLAGSEAASLRVAADARAALQHYPYADVTVQKELAKSVSDAYNNLAFSTFLHSDSLARSVWARVLEGTASVVAETDKLAFTQAGRLRDPDLVSVADHVGFIELLGRDLRENAGPDLSIHESRPLSAVWDVTKLRHSRRPNISRPEKEETIRRLDRLQMLYRDELTVLHDWEILRKNAENLSCEVELADIAAAHEWLAPWYVRQMADGQPAPANVLGGGLNERAQYDKLQVNASTPLWPNALEHGNLPHGMRTKGIDNLGHVLESQSSPTVCVLAYELCLDEGTGKTKRLVLDGNHRLAAAFRMSLEDTACSQGRKTTRRFRVLTFLIRERQPVDDLIATGGHEKVPYLWRGFTPDVGLVRGTWRPDLPAAEGQEGLRDSPFQDKIVLDGRP